MTSLAQMPPLAQLAHPPGQAEAVESIRSGNPFTCALSNDPAERTALLQSIVHALADMETRFTQIGNPLRSPLTLERLFMQAVGPEAEVRLERDPLTLTRMLAGPLGDESRLIIVVEQPETLDEDALAMIRAMGPHFASVKPAVQMLFCGPTCFAAMLHASSTAPVVQETAGETPAPISQAAPEPTPGIDAILATPSDPDPIPTRPRRRLASVLATLALGAVAVACAAGVLAWQRDPDLLRRHGLPIALPAALTLEPAAAAPAAPARAVEPPTRPDLVPPANAATARPASSASAAAPPVDTAALRREFDRFLADRPDAKGLSEARKDELFQEFLERRTLNPVKAP